MDAPSDRDLLVLAGEFRKYAGSREQAMRDRFGMGDVQFWAAVQRIVDAPSPEVAVEFAPLIARLRRQRDARLRQRVARRAS